jgi:hypothetical protein
MACAFCGGNPTTNEHIFPRWLERYLPGDRRQQREVARYGEGGFDVSHPMIGVDFRVNRVCAPCNNGWLSDLEAASIPVLDPLISGLQLRLLGPREQRQIALWAVKTAMLTDLTQAGPILDFRARSRLRTHRAIPAGTRVWLGSCGAINPLVTNLTVLSELRLHDGGETVVGFYSPMKIGHLCLYVYFPMGDVVIQMPNPYPGGLVRIWGRRHGDVAWPGVLIPPDGAGFEVWAGRLWRELIVLTPESAREQDVREF